ncbi:MAG TPA: hypothetical protein DFS52_10460 [Myxococcales bacterium]|jgi:hypothetical protein|nr:hypothetical protein [Myxococcales bacterium]
MIKRWIFVAAFTAALFLVVKSRFVLDDDPVRSLRQQDSPAARVFDRYHERSVFEGRIFVDFSGIEGQDRQELEALLKEAHYEPASMFTPPGPEAMASFLPLLPAEELAKALSDEAIQARAQEALSFAMLPGGAGYLAQMEKDPFGLGARFLQETLAKLGFSAGGGGADIRPYKSPSPVVYDEVGRVYEKLIGLGEKARFIGGDFFAYENYLAAQRDVVVCSTLSLVFNLALFLYFTRRLKPLLLLFVGSVVSYLAGILVVGLFYERVFALVLAFTSTFVGFNNEYLVHLSALPQGSKGKSMLGVWSAVGTTLLIFIVLLLGQSIIVRQMALASLGGMAGFLVVLYVFRSWLNEVRFRTFRWPKLSIGPRALVAVAGAIAVLLAVLPWPSISTSIHEFRVQSPALDEQTEYFTGKLGESNLSNVVAARVEGSALQTFEALAQAGQISTASHPLLAFRSEPQQQATIELLRARYFEAIGKLRAALQEAGLELRLDDRLAASLQPLSDWDYLTRLNALAPAKWAEEVDGQRYLFVSGKAGAAPVAGGQQPVEMSPQHYFDDLLTGLSRELAVLFAFGLAAMCAYLIALHRKPLRVLYVFVPLMLSAAVFLVVSALTGGKVSIIHFVGFSLVIALATDYASVAMSVDHHEVEMSKILLTALSTLGTFGVLIVAEHPVLKDLGITVTIGCVFASLVALFVKLRPEGAKPAAATSGGAQGGAPDEEAA